MHCGEDVAGALTEKKNNYQAHGDGENSVDPSGGLNTAGVQIGDQQSERDHPECIGNVGNDVAGGLAAPDDADDGVEDIVHQHRPADDVAELWVELLGDVAEGGARTRVDASHAPITDGGEQHGYHRDKDRGDHMSVGNIADYTVDAHGSRGLDDDDAVYDEMPQLQGTLELWRRG